MINANELFLNANYNHNGKWNYANHEGIFKWTDRDWFALGESTIMLENIKGIPITEDVFWQCNLGYTSTDERFNFTGVNSVEYVIEQQDDWWFIGINNTSSIQFFAWNIYHLHQLQNLYFALTGKELVYPPLNSQQELFGKQSF